MSVLLIFPTKICQAIDQCVQPFQYAMSDKVGFRSCMSSASRVPAHIRKIDKLFVENLVTSEEDRAILQAIHDLATAMGMQVVAEGIETADQLAVLTKIGFTRAQGYYWSPAVPADEVPAMVARLAVRQLLAPQPCHEGQPCHEDAQLASDVRLTSVHLASVESQPASRPGQRRMLD